LRVSKQAAIAIFIVAVIAFSIGGVLFTTINEGGGPTSINNLGTLEIKTNTPSTIHQGETYCVSGINGTLYTMFTPTSPSSFKGQLPTCTLIVSDQVIETGLAYDGYSNPYRISWTFTSLTMAGALSALLNSQRSDSYFRFSGIIASGIEVGGTSDHFIVQSSTYTTPIIPGDPIISGSNDQTLQSPISTQTLTWTILYNGVDSATWEIWDGGWWPAKSGTFQNGVPSTSISYTFSASSVGAYTIELDFHCTKSGSIPSKNFQDFVTITVVSSTTTTTTTTTIGTTTTTTTTTTIGTTTTTTTTTTTGMGTTTPTTTPDLFAQNLPFILGAVVIIAIVAFIIKRK
jgi:hypothetical protein